jgi:hypothetical protein
MINIMDDSQEQLNKDVSSPLLKLQKDQDIATAPLPSQSSKIAKTKEHGLNHIYRILGNNDHNS